MNTTARPSMVCATWLLNLLLSTQLSLGDQQLPDGLFVFGYANHLSVAQGETIALHLSSNAQTVDISIERVGAETMRVWEQSDVQVEMHSIPDRASSEGCHWPATLDVRVLDNWQSGYYRVNLSAQKNDQSTSSQSFFIVRPASPGSKSKILLQLATNTYNAYTNWGGHSLYRYHDRDDVQGHRVSFDRPISSQFEKWEEPFVRWAEQNGFELEYAANSDLEFIPDLLNNYKLVLSVGHDEYWSSPMRDALEAFIGNGGNVAFFSGNTCCWQVRSEDQGRSLTCWKQSFNSDPLFRSDDERLLSTAWSHHLVKRPENQLTGVGFLWGGYHRSHGQFMDGSGAYTIHRPEHWMLEGTGLKLNDPLGGQDTIVGYECDGCEMIWKDGLPFPTTLDGTPQTFTIVGTCPARWAADDCFWYGRFPKDRVGAAVLGVYTRGGTVFTCGSTDWAHGLQGGDANVARITSNILHRLSQP